jgi:hypothetical protein
MQLPDNYLPGIKSYDVPFFLRDSVSQEEWRALVDQFNHGMSDVRAHLLCCIVCVISIYRVSTGILSN